MRVRARLILCAVVATSACLPLPIAHQALVTPETRGDLREADGTTAAGAAIAITSSAQDSSCVGAPVHLRTDEQGRFSAPATTERKRWAFIPLLPFDTALGYWLCAGQVDEQGRPTYSARTYVNATGTDAVSCMRLEWDDAPRLLCNTRWTRRVIAGGEWREGDAPGTFRLLLLEGDQPGLDLRPVVQWITEDEEGRQLVRASVELPLEASSSWDPPSFSEQEGRWRVALPTTKSRRIFWNVTLVYELGGPGVYSLVPDA